MARTQQTRPFAVLADPAQLQRTAAQLNLAAPVEVTDPAHVAATFQRALPVIALSKPVNGVPGAPDDADAAMTLESIERAVAYVHAGQFAGVVTNPIAKEGLYRAGFRHPGHTEYLGELAQTLWKQSATPVMLLWSQTLSVVPVTIHVALAQAIRDLTTDLIVDTARITARELTSRFHIAKPRLVLAGLNPHAGEGGTMGREDIDVIVPAVERLRAEGIDARGPLSADTLFHAAARATYDVALCMYHDQALIPIKTLAFDSGVNVTLGLPFVRTSPDHGTAFNIAGLGRADPSSLIAALALADRLTRAQ